MSEDVRHREMIERHALDHHGLRPGAWVKDPENGDRVKVSYGRWYVTEDDEDRGLYEGDEGELHATVVGGIKYRNERVAYYLTPDDQDVGTEAEPYEGIEPAL